MEFVTSLPPFDSDVHLKCVPPKGTDHVAIIAELRERIQAHENFNEEYCTNHQLLLFLTARNFNVDDAHAMMVEALDWRAFRKPNEYMCSSHWKEELNKETETGKLYIPGQSALISDLKLCAHLSFVITGKDQWGRPLLIFDNSVQNTSCPDAHMRLLSWGLEFAVKMMPDTVDKYMIFMVMYFNCLTDVCA